MNDETGGNPTENLGREGTLSPGIGAAPAGPALPDGSLFAGRFRVLSPLGAGASSVVYRAADESLGMEVALKVYSPAFGGGDNSERIRREVETSRRLNHPNLIRTFEWGDFEGILYLVMELCPGGTLRTVMKAGEGLPADAACAHAGAILDALAALHAAGVIHRDVKPDNCFFAADGTLKVGDLGIVKADYWSTLTQTGAAMGTPKYMAPESIRGREAGPTSDLYSLGVTLFELLTGAAPFEGDSALEVASKQLDQPPPLRLLREKKVPGWLRSVVRRLLEKAPGDRYLSADAVLEALRRRRAGFSLPRRWRWRAASSAGLLLLLGALSGLRWWRALDPPLSPSFQEKTLTVRDSRGAILWTKALPRKIQSAHYGRFGPAGSASVACAVEWPEEELGRPDTALSREGLQRIYLFDRSGALLRRLSVGLHPSPHSPRYVVGLSSHAFRKGDAEHLVALLRHDLWYPTSILVFRTGDPSAIRSPDLAASMNFFNSGGIEPAMRYRDLDGDGEDEMLFTAVNNLLYRGLFAGALRLGTEGGIFAASSPDRTMAQGQAPLFYRCYGFEPLIPSPLIEDVPSRDLRILLHGGGVLTLGKRGELARDGRSLPPDPGEVERLNARLNLLCSLRGRGEHRRLIEACDAWPQESPEPYSWFPRFFRAEALEGLGRYAEVPGSLGSDLPSLEGEPPWYASQFLVNSAFLGGDYGGCLRRFSEAPSAAKAGKPEIGQTAVWAAVYGQQRAELESILQDSSLQLYAYTRAFVPALQLYFSGDFQGAEAGFRAFYPPVDLFAPPVLWYAESLARLGKVKEARGVLDLLQRKLPGEDLDGGETDLWLKWREGDRDPSLAARMDAVLDKKRAQARKDPEARALLPVTLARTASMHRALGDPARADALLAEALRLAPPSWRETLKTFR